jgi:death-on-curing protein
VDGNKRVALATCLIFLSENGLLHSEELCTDAWEAFTLDVASSKYDREGATERLQELLGAE